MFGKCYMYYVRVLECIGDRERTVFDTCPHLAAWDEWKLSKTIGCRELRPRKRERERWRPRVKRPIKASNISLLRSPVTIFPKWTHFFFTRHFSSIRFLVEQDMGMSAFPPPKHGPSTPFLWQRCRISMTRNWSATLQFSSWLCSKVN